jgi:serine/threonine protein kinase
LFQKNYTCKTDVWSCGVALYVLVAGYPADELQKAFNMLQKSKRSVRDLPNMPHDLPDSFYEMLEKLLIYSQIKRPTAGTILATSEFVKFHLDHAQGVADNDQDNDTISDLPTSTTLLEEAPKTRKKTTSYSLRGSVTRHSTILGFKNFERALTTLLATMLSKEELEKFLLILKEKNVQDTTVVPASTTINTNISSSKNGIASNDVKAESQQLKLYVVKISELKAILDRDFNQQALYVVQCK